MGRALRNAPPAGLTGGSTSFSVEIIKDVGGRVKPGPWEFGEPMLFPQELEISGMNFIRTISLAAILVPGAWLLTSAAHAQSPGNFSTLSTTGTATLNGD